MARELLWEEQARPMKSAFAETMLAGKGAARTTEVMHLKRLLKRRGNSRPIKTLLAWLAPPEILVTLGAGRPYCVLYGGSELSIRTGSYPNNDVKGEPAA